MKFLKSLFITLIVATTAHAQNVTLTVSAAASTQNALTQIGRDYTRAHPQTKVSFNFGSSGALQAQIEAGAPVDVFVSAADKQMNALQKQQLIIAATRRSIAGNTLVLIVPSDSKLPIARFKDVTQSAVAHVAIGGPSVPAGQRAQEVFSKLGVWPRVLAKAVRGKDVRAVLTQVEAGNVEAGVVYGSDARISSKVRVVSVAPASFHAPIRYPVAVVASSKNSVQARDFARYLSSARAKLVLRRFGFLVR